MYNRRKINSNISRFTSWKWILWIGWFQSDSVLRRFYNVASSTWVAFKTKPKPSADAHPCISSTCSREHTKCKSPAALCWKLGTFRNDDVLITKDCKGACDMCRHCWQLSSAARRTLPLVQRYWNDWAVLLRHQRMRKWHQHPIILYTEIVSRYNVLYNFK